MYLTFYFFQLLQLISKLSHFFVFVSQFTIIRSNPKTLATYGAWLVGGVSFGYFRKEFIDPKFESGEWKALSFELPFMSKPDAAIEVANTLTSKATGIIVDGITDCYNSVDHFA